MSWRRRRQFAIFLVIVTFLTVVAGFVYWLKKPEPTCFDGRQNGNELGIDCGGYCAKVCSVEVESLRPVWARLFEVRPGVYSAIGLFHNPNGGFASPEAHYKISFISPSGRLMHEEEGRTFVNPAEEFPVFASGFTPSEGTVQRVFISFTDTHWERNTAQPPFLSVARQNFIYDPLPRLEARLTNNSPYNLEGVEVTVVLSDSAGNAFTGSRTVVDMIGSGATENIFFTWPLPFREEPAFVDFYPRVSIFAAP